MRGRESRSRDRVRTKTVKDSKILSVCSKLILSSSRDECPRSPVAQESSDDFGWLRVAASLVENWNREPAETQQHYEPADNSRLDPRQPDAPSIEANRSAMSRDETEARQERTKSEEL